MGDGAPRDKDSHHNTLGHQYIHLSVKQWRIYSTENQNRVCVFERLRSVRLGHPNHGVTAREERRREADGEAKSDAPVSERK